MSHIRRPGAVTMQPTVVTVRTEDEIRRRMVVLSKYVLRGFSSLNGNPADPKSLRSQLRRHGLLDELTPTERAFLLDGHEHSPNNATWRSEALVMLRWVIGERASPGFDGQVSMKQAIPDTGTDAEIQKFLAARKRRAERRLRRELELWFVICHRLRLRWRGVETVDLRAWIGGSPYLTVLTADDVPMIDNDLSLSLFALGPPDLDPADVRHVLDDRVPIRLCDSNRLTGGDDIMRVAAERFGALRWLFGVTAEIEHAGIGLYRPDEAEGRNKTMLYGDAAPPAAAGYDAQGGLPLHRAAWRGDVATVRQLLAGGAATTDRDIDGDLPIHCAVLGGHLPTIKTLLARDAPFAHHFTDAGGRTAVHLAAARGDVAALDAIAARAGRSSGESWSDGTGECGRSALHDAIEHGQEAAVRRLFAPDTFVNGEGPGDRGSGIDAALGHDRPDMLRLLAGLGVPFDETVGGVTPLYRALFADRNDSALALLDLGADAAFVHESGTSALHVAAQRGATALCGRLLDGGADVNRRTDGLSAVHLAVVGGHRDTATLLLERGADPSGADPDPTDPDADADPLLMFAVMSGSAETIAWCLERGEPLADAPGALHGLASRGHVDAVRVLLAAGAAPGELNGSGLTALHLAADQGHDDCVAALLAAGAPVDERMADRGLTALHLAAMHGHDDCVRLLLDAGADREAPDAVGRSALDWSVRGHHSMTAEMLSF